MDKIFKVGQRWQCCNPDFTGIVTGVTLYGKYPITVGLPIDKLKIVEK